MKQHEKQTGLVLPSELRWRLAILTALAVSLPLLSQSGVSQKQSAIDIADVTPALHAKGQGMAGMLPGVSPITFGRAPSASFDTPS